MSVRNLEALFRPKAIALIGAERRDGGIGHTLARNVFNGGFDGPILPVHATERAIQGVLTYPSVDQLPLTPDLALIASPANDVPALLDQLGRRGTSAAIVYATDFGGSGPLACNALLDNMHEAARPKGLRVVGPACLGVILPTLGVNASFAESPVVAGDLAFVSQSGSILDAMLGWAAGRGVGFSLAASLGDMADVDLGDVLDYLAFDYTSRAVLMYVERISASRKFLSAARALARLKPVIVYRPAAIGEEPVLDIDGRPLIDSDVVFDAAFQRAGMLPVTHLGDLVAAAQTLSSRRRPAGDRLAIVANGRGLGTAVADAVRAHSGVLSALAPSTVAALDEALPPGWGCRNPVNVFSNAGADRYRAAVDALLADEGVDAVLAMLGPSAVGDRFGAADAVAEVLGRARKPGVAIWFGNASERARSAFAANQVPVYDGAGEAVTAVTQLAKFRRNQDMLMETPASMPELFASDVGLARRVVNAALADGRSYLTAEEAAALLAAYRVPSAAKADRADASHDNRVDALRIAVGIDTSFGPVIVFGAGRLPAGIASDRAAALPPLNMTLARLLIAETQIGRVIASFGAERERTLEEIALTLTKVSQILTDLPEVAGIDIDPLLARGSGIFAERCRVRVASGGAFNRRLAIRPYPRELEKLVSTRKGRLLQLRPIRPEDEPALQEFVRAMDPDDVRLRFFAPIKELEHRFAARLTQIDYDREMAFVIVDPSASEDGIMGVMRLNADADNASAEYAGAVRSDLKGHGLGRMLMEEIIDYARRDGIKEIWGSVLSENAAMLGLTRKLGFNRKSDPNDPSIVHVSLDVQNSDDGRPKGP